VNCQGNLRLFTWGGRERNAVT